MVQGPRTSMVRPHPVLWRLVHGLAVVYVVGLVWLLFQSASDARAFLRVRGACAGAGMHAQICAGAGMHAPA